VSSASSSVASPSTSGGIADSSVMPAKRPAQSQVIAVVIARKPSVRAVTASTDAVA
jgi:hypothetical protein